MNAAENNIVQALTGKPSLQDTLVEELQELTSRYPYFSIGQLLFTKKIQQAQPEKFASQYEQCVIYFQDAAWLQSQLYNNTIASDKSALQAYSSNIDTNGKDNLSSKNKTPTTLPETAAAENANTVILPAANVPGPFSLQMNDVKDEPELSELDEEELAGNSDEAATDVTSKIAGVLQHQVANFKAPIKAEAPLQAGNEPFYTIDYFASQGIKADTQQQDALSKKVHTFTDWLRQMKRISQQPSDLGSDPAMESYVQSIADSSNQPKVVDTEAMAEVLAKQGKLDKAIEMYQKLSLLNPAKTAYFAAKIHQLKAS